MSAEPVAVTGVENASPMLTTTLAAALSGAAAAWMVGGIFRDPAARGVGMLGVLLAAALLISGYRLGRPTLVQFLILPAAALLGALLVLPDARGGSATLPSLVLEAVKSGGLLQPPLAFDPGWRFIVVLLPALITAAAGAVALGSNRPRLGVLVPLAVTVPAALVQPDSSEVLSAAGSLALVAAAMAVAYGADLARDTDVSGGFETTRLLRGVGFAVVLSAAALGLSRTGFLFPQPTRDRVVPAQRPGDSPPVADRVLFTVRSDHPGVKFTYREGVISDYSATTGHGAWLFPPFDSRRLREVHPPASLPDPRPAPSSATDLASVTFSIRDVSGHTIPTLPGAVRVAGTSEPVQFNPDTQALSLLNRPAFRGLTYSVSASLPPTGADLATAPDPPAALRSFLSVPAAPAEVVALLAQAPKQAFARLQFMRKALYEKVTAAGEGRPVDVSPARVAEMLDGSEASPYEITAAEALLARWVGLPSRMAYGYYGGDPQPDGSVAIHPTHGATWLEAYFQGYGWVPIVGVPPKAKASFSEALKNSTPGVQASDALGLVLYVPIRQHTVLAYYQLARYYVVLVAPYLLALLVLGFGYPLALKALRGSQRRRWADRRGPRARVGVAYAEFRDAARDLGVGDSSATPLGFVDLLARDAEHRELAWLVTRATWGDLQRDLQVADAEAAEEMSRSVGSRLAAAQPVSTRLLALLATASLRDPFAADIPNPWPRWHLPRVRLSLPGGRARRRRIAAFAGALVLALGIGGIPRLDGAAKGGPSPVDDLVALVPARVGAIELRRETSIEGGFNQPDALVSEGRVFTVRHDVVIEGSVQVSRLKPDVRAGDEDLLHGLEQNIGNGHFNPMEVPRVLWDGDCHCRGGFHMVRVEDEAVYSHQHVYVMALPDQRVYLWFPPRANSMELVVLRRQFTVASADALVLGLLDFQHGVEAAPVPIPVIPSPSSAPSPSPGAAG
ncbi:MAG: transglutaminase-like domain-containing protein [Candidatus Dormibacteria bacterium]